MKMVHDGTWMGNLTTSARANTNTTMNQHDGIGSIKHMQLKRQKTKTAEKYIQTCEQPSILLGYLPDQQNWRKRDKMTNKFVAGHQQIAKHGDTNE